MRSVIIFAIVISTVLSIPIHDDKVNDTELSQSKNKVGFDVVDEILGTEEPEKEHEDDIDTDMDISEGPFSPLAIGIIVGIVIFICIVNIAFFLFINTERGMEKWENMCPGRLNRQRESDYKNLWLRPLSYKRGDHKIDSFIVAAINQTDVIKVLVSQTRRKPDYVKIIIDFAKETVRARGKRIAKRDKVPIYIAGLADRNIACCCIYYKHYLRIHRPSSVSETGSCTALIKLSTRTKVMQVFVEGMLIATIVRNNVKNPLNAFLVSDLNNSRVIRNYELMREAILPTELEGEMRAGDTLFLAVKKRSVVGCGCRLSVKLTDMESGFRLVHMVVDPNGKLEMVSQTKEIEQSKMWFSLDWNALTFIIIVRVGNFIQVHVGSPGTTYRLGSLLLPNFLRKTKHINVALNIVGRNADLFTPSAPSGEPFLLSDY